MNIPSVNTNINNRYNYNQRGYAPAFGAVADILPRDSKLLSPLKRGYDRLTTGISEKYTDKIYTSKFAAKLADYFSKHKKFDAVNLMQILGSTVISGMYMLRTMQNKDLDEDKKPILALNQFLTFAVSTVLGLTIDSGLNKWWEKRTVKYLEKKTGDNTISQQIKQNYEDQIKMAENRLGKPFKEFTKQEIKDSKFKKISALKYLETHEAIYNRDLRNKILGMGVFKKLVIFGLIYRYFSPVVVTPIANNLGEKMLANKKAKAEVLANENK